MKKKFILVLAFMSVYFNQVTAEETDTETESEIKVVQFVLDLSNEALALMANEAYKNEVVQCRIYNGAKFVGNILVKEDYVQLEV
ncbi:MAG: hypothetical protein GY828_06870, partial [Candidatus Gracilibacteria bacterium]|nr:hypothetical protein [Candidatus Gracilibacteria bacterium]